MQIKDLLQFDRPPCWLATKPILQSYSYLLEFFISSCEDETRRRIAKNGGQLCNILRYESTKTSKLRPILYAFWCYLNLNFCCAEAVTTVSIEETKSKRRRELLILLYQMDICILFEYFLSFAHCLSGYFASVSGIALLMYSCWHVSSYHSSS